MASHSGSGSIGLEFNEKWVKAVELRQAAAGPTLTRIALAEIPPRLETEDPSALIAKTITDLLATNHFEAKDVYVAVSGPQVQTRRISLPLMPDDELRQAVRWEAKNFITFPLEKALIEYYAINKENNRQASKSELLAVAIEAVTYQKQLLILEQAGIKPAGITIAPLAVQEIFTLLPPFLKNELVAVLDLGEATASLSLFKNNFLQFTRGIDLTGDDPAAMLAAVHKEIAASFDFFRENYFEEKVARLFISGDQAGLPDLQEALSAALGLTIERLEPTKGLLLDPQVNTEIFQQNLSRLTLAIGLALGRCQHLNLLKGKEKKAAPKVEALRFLDYVQVPNAAIIATLVGLVIALIGFNFYINSSIETAKKELNVQSLRLNQLIKYRDRKLAFQDIIGKEIDVKQLLLRVNALLPRGMSLSTLAFDNDKKEVELGGECDDPRLATGFLKKVEESPYFSHTELVGIRKVGELSIFQVKLSVR
jgi:Tfp pilus assembly PilM family ATPase